jgi:hypothetical protein
VIGDIHGQADKLDALLSKMGYAERGSLWVPPQGKQAVFVGDLIDRAPEQIRVVETAPSINAPPKQRTKK